jgi:hypothetical protein
MNKLYTFALTLLAVQAFAQSKNPSDYKTNATGFYENKGQIVDQNYNPNPAVKYLYNGNGLNVQLRSTGFSYDTYVDTKDKSTDKTQETRFPLKGKDGMGQPESFTRHFHRIDIELVGCNTAAPMVSEDKSEAYYNYFTAGTPQGGVSEVHTFQKVTYKNIYPNIDLVFEMRSKGKDTPSPLGEGRNGAVEYNFIIHPGGDYKQIKLQYKGADGIKLQAGEILIPTSNGNVTENIPASYMADTKQPVQVTYTTIPSPLGQPNGLGAKLEKDGATFGFSIPSSALSLSALNSDLIIDPTPNLLWGTYYGAAGVDEGIALALDASSNVYVTGYTGSTNAIATAGAYQTTFGGGPNGDVFIAKFNSTGSSLVWGTYYGGIYDDYGWGITLDASNNVYVTGYAGSQGMATAGAYKTISSGQMAFVAKFNSSGTSLLWGTYYGGGSDYAQGIAIDASDNVYITGFTQSTSGIATVGAYKTILGATVNAFVAKFNSTGSSLMWGTYYGGTGQDEGYAIALDAGNNVYITGYAQSTSGIATVGAYQTVQAGADDAFVAKFNSTGSSLIWGTYYGGTGQDLSQCIALDASDNVYIAGFAGSSGMATAGTYQTTLAGARDAVVAKFNPTGSSLIWATYYGGTADDYAEGIALDASNNVYVTGYTYSPSGMATVGAYQTTNTGVSDGNVFVGKFNSNGTSLVWGTYYGGTWSLGYGIALNASDNVYIAGFTNSVSGVSTVGAYQTVTGNNGDILVAEFSSGLLTASVGSITNVKCFGSCTGSATVNASGGTIPYTYNWTPSGGTNATASNLCAGSYTCTVKDATAATVIVSVTITQPNQLRDSVSAQTNISCFGGSNGSLTVGVKGGTASYTYAWAPGGGTTPTITGLSAACYTVTVTDANSCSVTASACITQPNQLRDSVSAQTNITCFGSNNGSLTVGVKGGTASYTYSWNNGKTTATITGLSAACYTVTVTDANSCSVTASACITQPNQLRDSISAQTNITCFGSNNGSLTVGVKGGTAAYTYLWTPAGQTTATITGLTVGCYTVNVTDSHGCSGTASACITEPPQLRDSIASVTNISCNAGNNGSATVGVKGGTGAYTYTWAPSGGANATANNLTTGSYTVTVKDANGCSVTASANITQPTALTSSTSANTAICFGSCTTISVTAGGGTPAYSYSWSNGNTTSSQNVCPTSTTTYTITVTDNNGCTKTASVMVTVNALPVVTMSAAKDTACVNWTTDALTGNPSGGTFTGTGVTGTNFDPNTAGAGTHKIVYTYTDGNGCTNKDSINIHVNLCTGVPEVNLLESQVKFYPNPFMQSINIDNSTNEAVSITMFNMMGQQMGTWQLNKGINTISTSTMPSGVYMVQVKTKDGILNKKLVKVN